MLKSGELLNRLFHAHGASLVHSRLPVEYERAAFLKKVSRIVVLMTWKPLHFFAVAIAGWMNRQQQEAIEYLKEENRILREKLGHKRLILNESQKRRLAEAAGKLGKDLLRQVGTMFSPETLLKWQRTLVARKYDGSDRRGKRGPKPTKANMIRKLVIQMAQENPSWGCASS